MKNPLVVILLGPPGSGKGTQTKLLQQKFCLERIGSGALLRERKEKKDYTGKKIGQSIDKGNRVATPVIFYLWMKNMEVLKQDINLKGFIVDGSPRTVFEAEMLELAFEWYDWHKNKKVIFVDLSSKESIQRLTKRRMCRKCKKIIPYIGEFKKLKKCDECGGKLFSRADDTIAGVQKRLAWFKTDVKPAIRYYEKRKELIKINGNQPIEDVFKDILKALK